MDGLIEHEQPEVKLATMVVAFAGWPDAGEAATRTVRHLVDKLPARKLAEIEPEDFYDFTSVRPQTRLNDEGQRYLVWPANDFYYGAPEEGSQGFLLLVGTEPNLRWRNFSNILLNMAERYGVELVISVGALLNAVPHTREPQVTGLASLPEMTQKLEWLGVRNTGYQGPTAIHSAFMDVCTKHGIPYVGIWGHCPHYVNRPNNPMVTYALLKKLRDLVDFDADLDELRQAGETFVAEVNRVVSKQTEVAAYVKRLEQRYDAAKQQPSEMPRPDVMVAELEEFLRSQRRSEEPPDDS